MPRAVDMSETITALKERYVSDGLWTDETFPDYVARWAEETPDQPALVDAGERITYRDLAERVDKLAGGLSRLGLDRGDVVAIQLPNSVDFVTAYLAVSHIGAVMQTVHMPYRGAELEFLLRHGGARALVCAAEAAGQSPAAMALELTSALPALDHVIAAGGAVPGTATLAELATGEKMTERTRLSGEDRFLLLYTSGTTADPKGVPHRYRGFVYNARSSVAELGFGPGDIALPLAPMTHLYGLFSFHLALVAGATTALMPAFSPPAFAATVEACRATTVFAAPAHLAASLNMGLLDAHDFSSVRFIFLSGSVVPPELARAVEDKLPNGVTLQLWGMSETQAGTYTRPSDTTEVRQHTAGTASPNTELRIVNDGNEPLGADKEGRLQVRGPSAFEGYLDNPAATAAAFDAEGWFDTGDTAMLSDGGHLTITGRVKEIINRGGVKYNPIDVEQVIDRMDEVERSAIVPYHDDVLGERGCVFVVISPGASVSLNDITSTLDGAGIAKFKWPERLEFIDDMPLTPTQKIMRGRLAARLSAS